MSDLIPVDPGHPKFKIAPLLYKILFYLGIAVLIFSLGFFLTPSIPDEIVAEIVWVAFIAFIEIKKLIDDAKLKK